jgi:hypothetical protein
MSYNKKLTVKGIACQGKEGSINSVEATETDTSDTGQIANFAKIAGIKKSTTKSDEEEIEIFSTPTIPETVYNCLPKLLKRNCKVFESARERDVFLTGAITILSGCMDTVSGVYYDGEVYSNLNCFIIAPAASGKSALVHAKALGNAHHENLLAESNIALKKYNQGLRRERNNDQSSAEDILSKPPFKLLYIPGNSSSSAIIKHLMEGDAKGIFCETEADTLANSLQQDWGNFSDMLRKAFHHETVSYSRKTNNEFYEIKRPRLSVALSGTPSQVERLISSAEDGLFSRFIFYVFSAKAEWRSVTPIKGRTSLTKHFDEQSKEVLKVIKYLGSYPSDFNLTDQQWVLLNEQFNNWFDEVNKAVGGEALSVIKRLGLISFRIAMILTCLRKYERKEKGLSIICSDNDFKVAMQLVEVYKEHSLVLFNRLPQSGDINLPVVRQFFKDLPIEFKRKEAVPVGYNVGLGERTIDKYLQVLMESRKLKKSKYGHYSKV